MKVLNEEGSQSMMRLCVFMISLAVAFHICYASYIKLNIEWANIAVLVGVVFGAKVLQKKVELENKVEEQQ